MALTAYSLTGRRRLPGDQVAPAPVAGACDVER